MPREVDAESGTKINAKLFDAVANTPAVAEVPQTDSVQSGANHSSAPGILQAIQPFGERTAASLAEE